MRILVVAQSILERRALCNKLKRLGHQCRAAADGATASAVLAAGGVDVVISDWQLPDLDGLELCRRVRADEAAEYTYVIILTPTDDRTQARWALEAGADDYLAKPFDAEALEIAMIAAARLSALHREQQAAQRQAGRLEGVRLAARTMRHELGNKLAVTVLFNELLTEQVDASTELYTAAVKALHSAREAAQIMDQLGRVTQPELIEWGADVSPTLRVVAASA